jgi:hypothetical protein
MLNRQLRRAQKKQDEKVEKERQKRKDKRRAKVSSLKERRARRRQEALERAQARKRGEEPAKPRATESGSAAGSSGARRRRPGRFSAALMMATVFFIVLQSAVPPERPGEIDVLRSVTSAGFYLLFAYFSTLWLMRRDTPRPILMTLITGGMLTLGVEVAKYFQPDMGTDWLMLALAVPFLVAGALLGRLVYVNSPA